MSRKVAKKPGPTAHMTVSPTTPQTGTKESPILLLSDDESEGEEDISHPSAVKQKAYLAMGYKPDRGLGTNLRGNVRPLPIELRKPSAGVGHRTTTVSRSPSPAPPPKKAPVKIIRPPKEPVASTSKIEQHVAKAALQTSSLPKARAQKPALPNPTHNPLPNAPKRLASTKQSSSPLTVVSPLPPSPVPFVPSDLYISLMSGLAMANMPQTMQVAAAAGPMAAFQLAQMCFAPPPPYPLPPFSLVPPQPDHAPVQRHIHTPNLLPKTAFNPSTMPNSKITPLPDPSSILQGGNSNAIDPPSVTIEMDPFRLRQKRQARKNSIGWIPEPGLPARGIFDLVPTIDYVRWSSSEGVTALDPQRSLVMEDLPCNCRTVKFVRSWADQFSATAVCLNGNGKALIEFPSREMAEVAYDSPRLRGRRFNRATHVRVFWYRPKVEDVPNDITLANIATTPGEPVPMITDDLSLKAETTELEKGKGSPLLDVDLSVQTLTVSAFTPRPGSPFAVTPAMEGDQGEQRRQSDPVDRGTNVSLEGSSRSPVSSSPHEPPISRVQVLSRLHSPSSEPIERKRTPSGSPPSLRYPSSTPEMTNDRERVTPPSEETPMHDTPPPTFSSDPSVAGDHSLEQQLRMRLLAVKEARIGSQSYESSSASSTPSTVIDRDSDTFFKTASPSHSSGTTDGVVISESLELLATSFITDTIQAAQGSPSEADRFDTAIDERLGKKRGFNDAFGSSADIAFKRQQLAQQIEESKKIMKRLKAAKTKEERTQIYASWEESNRSAELVLKPAAAPFQWPCYAKSCLIVDSDDEDDMDLS